MNTKSPSKTRKAVAIVLMAIVALYAAFAMSGVFAIIILIGAFGFIVGHVVTWRRA